MIAQIISDGDMKVVSLPLIGLLRLQNKLAKKHED